MSVLVYQFTKKSIKAPHYWLFVKRIMLQPVSDYSIVVYFQTRPLLRFAPLWPYFVWLLSSWQSRYVCGVSRSNVICLQPPGRLTTGNCFSRAACRLVTSWWRNDMDRLQHIEGILPKGPYLPCVSMAGWALLAGYPRYLALRAGNTRVTGGFLSHGASNAEL